MKKLSLKKLKLEATDLLQRNELKTIFGGYGGYGSNSTGYFLYGDCFVYGTMYTANDDSTFFAPCTTCVAIEPICPGPNEGFA